MPNPSRTIPTTTHKPETRAIRQTQTKQNIQSTTISIIQKKLHLLYNDNTTYPSVLLQNWIATTLSWKQNISSRNFTLKFYIFLKSPYSTSSLPLITQKALFCLLTMILQNYFIISIFLISLTVCFPPSLTVWASRSESFMGISVPR